MGFVGLRTQAIAAFAEARKYRNVAPIPCGEACAFAPPPIILTKVDDDIFTFVVSNGNNRWRREKHTSMGVLKHSAAAMKNAALDEPGGDPRSLVPKIDSNTVGGRKNGQPVNVL